MKTETPQLHIFRLYLKARLYSSMKWTKREQHEMNKTKKNLSNRYFDNCRSPPSTCLASAVSLAVSASRSTTQSIDTWEITVVTPRAPYCSSVHCLSMTDLFYCCVSLLEVLTGARLGLKISSFLNFRGFGLTTEISHSAWSYLRLRFFSLIKISNCEICTCDPLPVSNF